MNLKQFKKKVYESLVNQVGQFSADRLMKAYEIDFPLFLKKKWTPEYAAFAMVNGY